MRGMRLEPFGLERWMTTYETRVKYDIAESGILPMTTSDLLELVPSGDRAASLETLLRLPLGYSEARGTEELRGLLAATYLDASAENILVTTGAIEANFLLFNVLVSAGDHVIAPHPAYQQLYSVPRALGCDVSLWEVRPENGFRYDLDELSRLIRPTTKLIVVNTPHNPSGAILSAAELARVYDLASSVGAMVLCDEAYRWLTIPGGDALAPPAFDLGSSGISVGTVSKPFGLPGLRIGWIAAPREIVAACWGMRDYVSLSPGRLSDALACLAIRHRDRIVERNHTIVAENLARARAWIASHAGVLSWREPRAGLLALLRYELDIPSLDLANRLAEEYSVMLAPGSVFGYEHHLRIGIGQRPSIFAEGLQRTGECLTSFKSRRAFG
ncbi:MAG: aminotransferase class I/II-fold pyridoxal phosphate-dependent enzyme [Acidobacteria bacterium]|nr:aminotransferase class I/II-fold pyridoxal phosphate-dependent enzyme [Acidobacteriota bacterium]